MFWVCLCCEECIVAGFIGGSFDWGGTCFDERNVFRLDEAWFGGDFDCGIGGEGDEVVPEDCVAWDGTGEGFEQGRACCEDLIASDVIQYKRVCQCTVNSTVNASATGCSNVALYSEWMSIENTLHTVCPPDVFDLVMKGRSAWQFYEAHVKSVMIATGNQKGIMHAPTDPYGRAEW